MLDGPSVTATNLDDVDMDAVLLNITAANPSVEFIIGIVCTVQYSTVYILCTK